MVHNGFTCIYSFHSLRSLYLIISIVTTNSTKLFSPFSSHYLVFYSLFFSFFIKNADENAEDFIRYKVKHIPVDLLKKPTRLQLCRSTIYSLLLVLSISLVLCRGNYNQ